MNKEHELVVKPLKKWFESQKAQWVVKIPDYVTAATGWDLEVQRKNQDLLIEAKYIKGPFINSFAGLTCAVLSNRPQKLLKTKYRSWNHGVCWAIGTSYVSRDVYQILFDYLSRNFEFWIYYGKYFKMKYVFFVQDGAVIKVPWPKLVITAKKYKQLTMADTSLKNKRVVAQKLMSKF